MVWLTLILVASCTPEAERDEAVASTPQALTLPAADLTGMVAGDRLGASLAACRSGAYLAGAPGKAAFMSSQGTGGPLHHVGVHHRAGPRHQRRVRG